MGSKYRKGEGRDEGDEERRRGMTIGLTNIINGEERPEKGKTIKDRKV
jgi:hypothetical protein